MGMVSYIREITPDELDAFRASPRTVREKLHAETMAFFPPSVRPIMEELSKVRFNPWKIRRLEKQYAEAMAAARAAGESGVRYDPGYCLEKSWHEVHYLITGTAEDAPPPLGNAILGGTPIGDDNGYGPARFLTARETREVAEALSAIQRDEIARRCREAGEPPRSLYGFVSEDNLDDLLFYFDGLVKYYAEAAARGSAMLLYIR